jgi:hypothetical protein
MAVCGMHMSTKGIPRPNDSDKTPLSLVTEGPETAGPTYRPNRRIRRAIAWTFFW